MGMSMGPTGTVTDEQLLEALNQKTFDEKKREEKEFNAYINAVQDLNAFTQHIITIRHYQETREKIFAEKNIEVRKQLEEKAREFNETIKAYYAEQKQTAEQQLADYDKKDFTEKNHMLDSALEEVKNKKEELLKGWVSPDNSETDKKMWVGKTWDQGIKAQAKHYAEKNDTNVLTAINEDIAGIEQKGIQLSKDEKTQLRDARTEALRVFQEQLELTQKEQKPSSHPVNLMVQLKQAGLMVNARLAVNEVIVTLNKSRPKESQIPTLDPSVSKAVAFTKQKPITDDMNQMVANMQNYLMLEALDRQEKALNEVKSAVSSQKTIENIMHCEVKATSPSVYDADGGSRFAIQPDGGNHYSILKKACDAVNQETHGEKVVLKQNGRNMEFEYNNQRFRFDTRSNKFSADNINPETFQMMMKVYNEVYKGSDTEVRCDGPASKNLCDAGIKEVGIPKTQVVLESSQSILSKENVAREQQQQAQQDMSASRRMT